MCWIAVSKLCCLGEGTLLGVRAGGRRPDAHSLRGGIPDRGPMQSLGSCILSRHRAGIVRRQDCRLPGVRRRGCLADTQ